MCSKEATDVHSQLLVTLEKHAKRGLRAIGVMQPPPKVRLTPIVLLRMQDPAPARAAQLPLSFYAQKRDLSIGG
jgi:hypothetical protein